MLSTSVKLSKSYVLLVVVRLLPYPSELVERMTLPSLCSILQGNFILLLLKSTFQLRWMQPELLVYTLRLRTLYSSMNM